MFSTSWWTTGVPGLAGLPAGTDPPGAEQLDALGVKHVTDGASGRALDVPVPARTVIRLDSTGGNGLDQPGRAGYARSVDVKAGRPVTVPAITVYYRPGCPFAAKLRLRLKLARIPYRTVDFTTDAAAAAEVRGANGGDELSPTVHVGSRYLPNPRLNDVRRALRDEQQQ